MNWYFFKLKEVFTIKANNMMDAINEACKTNSIVKAENIIACEFLDKCKN